MGLYEVGKDLLKIAVRLGDMELQQKLNELILEGGRLADENARLRAELRDLREQVEAVAPMRWHNNAYWRLLEDGKLEGPYCPKCRDGARKAARMSERSDDNYWRCPVCGYTMLQAGRSYAPPEVITRDPNSPW